MSSRRLHRSKRRGCSTACQAAAWIAACVFCLGLSAQERAPFDRPVPGDDSLAPADPATANVRRVFFELRLAETEPVRGLTFEATVKSSGKKLNLHYTTVVSNGDVSRARVVESNGRYEVAIRLTDEGAAKMAAATARHVGRPLAIVLDGGVVSDLMVGRALGAEIMLSASLTQAEAMNIAAGLNKW